MKPDTTMIPAAIAAKAMEAIMSGTPIEDAVFMAAIDITHECYDKPWTREYGLNNWANLSTESRKAWDWVFGRLR